MVGMSNDLYATAQYTNLISISEYGASHLSQARAVGVE